MFQLSIKLKYHFDRYSHYYIYYASQAGKCNSFPK